MISLLLTRPSAPLAVVCLVLLGSTLHATDPAQLEFFEKKIRPVLAQRCFGCHSESAEKLRGELKLDSAESFRSGGKRGALFTAGDAKGSLLLRALKREGDLKMPPDAPLDAAVIRDFETWIESGAAYSERLDAAENASAGHWSFSRPRRHELPEVQQQGWVSNPIDAFVLAGLERESLQPNEATNRRTFIRRVSLLLNGLPPTPEQVQSFEGDDRPDAFERVVDAALAAPSFGEKWARLWLDVSRFAEDQAHIVGNNQSLFLPNAYIFREWVIKAFNADMPIDRFTRLQLAADMLGEEDELPALGFLGLGPKYYNRGKIHVKAAEWDDRVDTVTRGLLGLTVSCARCHDHKFDPVSTEDYHALAGVFASTQMFNKPIVQEAPIAAPKQDASAKDKKKNQKKDKQNKLTMHIVREGRPTDINVFIRGDTASKGPVVKRRFLSILSDGEPKPFVKGSGRQELADAIVDTENPLTARVFVNRVWAEIFGRGIVGTTSNFGLLGDRPSHPELLDDLAVRFMEEGWSLKWLIREMVLSSTFRQSSDIVAEKQAVDPDARLLWRMRRRRLPVEGWRDSLLSYAGELDTRIGGRSIDIQSPAERRRTLYSKVSRFQLNKMLSLFDFPDPNAHAAGRVETTTALQKMFVLNSRFMHTKAESLAKRLEALDSDNENRIRRAYWILFSREPQERELELGMAFVSADSGVEALWVQYAQALLASNEILFLD